MTSHFCVILLIYLLKIYFIKTFLPLLLVSPSLTQKTTNLHSFARMKTELRNTCVELAHRYVTRLIDVRSAELQKGTFSTLEENIKAQYSSLEVRAANWLIQISFIDFKRRKEPVTSLLLSYKAARSSQLCHGDAQRRRALKTCVICGGYSSHWNRRETHTRRLDDLVSYSSALEKDQVTGWNMKFFAPVVVLFFVLCQVFGEELGPKEDPDYWTNNNQLQVRFFTLISLSLRLKSICRMFFYYISLTLINWLTCIILVYGIIFNLKGIMPKILLLLLSCLITLLAIYLNSVLSYLN